MSISDEKVGTKQDLSEWEALKACLSKQPPTIGL